MNDDTLVLYIIMRTDLESLNPGKAMAQANHAFGALKKRIRANIARQPDYIAWQETTSQDYGTCIVLGGNEEEIQEALDDIQRLRLPVLARSSSPRKRTTLKSVSTIAGSTLVNRRPLPATSSRSSSVERIDA